MIFDIASEDEASRLRCRYVRVFIGGVEATNDLTYTDTETGLVRGVRRDDGGQIFVEHTAECKRLRGELASTFDELTIRATSPPALDYVYEGERSKIRDAARAELIALRRRCCAGCELATFEKIVAPENLRVEMRDTCPTELRW